MHDHKAICDRILRLAGRASTEVMIVSTDSALTRFADNVISQNVSNTATEISVRVLDKGRVTRFSLNQPSEGALRTAFKNAFETLKTQKKDPHLMPLAKPAPVQAGKGLFFKATAELSPAERAGRVSSLVRKCKKAGATAYGTFDNGVMAITVANTSGVRSFHKESYSNYSVTVRDGNGMGWAEAPAFDVRGIDFDKVDRTAMEKARMARNPRSVKPGRYTVILEPAAVTDLMFFMGIYGFGAQSYQEGQSFVTGKLGKKVMSEKITITDNALEGLSAGMPFDYEGLPRQKVTLVDKGVARAVVHDRKTAALARAKSTGHSLPMPNTFGPIPVNMSMTPGKTSMEEMIRGTKKGILVTTFHYTNLLKPLTVEMTGMTRNGTYMIENGRIAYPIKNLRFTQSAVEAFANVEAVGDEPQAYGSWGRVAAPALKIKDFNFSSATEF